MYNFNTEAVARMSSVKKVFIKNSQNPKQNVCAVIRL